jgi:hypothetical protein
VAANWQFKKDRGGDFVIRLRSHLHWVKFALGAVKKHSSEGQQHLKTGIFEQNLVT